MFIPLAITLNGRSTYSFALDNPFCVVESDKVLLAVLVSPAPVAPVGPVAPTAPSSPQIQTDPENFRI